MENFYGEMDVPKKAVRPVLISCSKCSGQFSAEKRHSTLKLESAHYTKDPKGILTHKTITTDQTYRFCPSCIMKFKQWMSLP